MPHDIEDGLEIGCCCGPTQIKDIPLEASDYPRAWQLAVYEDRNRVPMHVSIRKCDMRLLYPVAIGHGNQRPEFRDQWVI